MDFRDDYLERRAAVDRREVDPPIQVETATWSNAGRLDWWVKDRQEWWDGYVVQTAVNGGSKLLIFASKRADSPQGGRLNSYRIFERLTLYVTS